MSERHCPTCVCGRRAPVQGSRDGGEKQGVKYGPHGAGAISWAEHEEAWAVYGARYSGQDAERIAERGGFSYGELVEFLGREPTTWAPYRLPVWAAVDSTTEGPNDGPATAQ